MSIIGPDVFLGGSCNPTTWRKDTAIPLLEAAGITYYDPQLMSWSLELVEIEAQAKVQARNYLFVIDSETRAIVSMIEVAGILVGAPLAVYLVVMDIEPGTVIGDVPISDRELRDLNKGRAYLRDLARKYDVIVHESVAAAVRAIIEDW